jgi:hypothetical protein
MVRVRVLLVGDTHGNIGWLRSVVYPAADLVSADAICQLGDFGFWADDFLKAARSSPVPFFFLDGNHENHDLLRELVAGSRAPFSFGGNLIYLPRGSSLEWGGVVVGFLGGAVSIDRGYRTAGLDWFAAEAIDEHDLAAAENLQGCRVLLTHDAPSGFELPLPPVQDPVWRSQLPACEDHRERLADVVDRVRPELVVHGHYHARWDRIVEREWGSYRLRGLSEDGSAPEHHLSVLDCTDGDWSLSDLSR